MADVREPKSYQSLADEVMNIMVDFLVVGDERMYAIERKSVYDLWKSVTDGRLWRQIQRLLEFREEGYIPVMVVTGNIYRVVKHRKIRLTLPQFYMILTAIGEAGITVVHLQKDEHFGLFIKSLDNRAGKKSKSWRPPRPLRKQNRSLEDEAIDVLAMISGIGPSTAEELLKELGSLKNVVNASREELAGIIGDKKAGHMHRLFNHVYRGEQEAYSRPCTRPGSSC